MVAETYSEMIGAFKEEAAKLFHRYELSKNIAPDYFEPGMMEYLDKSYGLFDENTGAFLLRFESKGTRYGDRTEQIEDLSIGDSIAVIRDAENEHNSNNFFLTTSGGKDVGNMPAELCNVIAPLYDAGLVEISDSKVSFVEPISKRSRYAKQAILFVEIEGKIKMQGEKYGI